LEGKTMKKYYKFNDSKGKTYWYAFESADEARRYAYVHGLCFLGS